MADRPIIFSAPMVRALLEGRKTQTRRVLKPQPEPWAQAVEFGPYKGYARPGELIQRTLDDHRQYGCGKCRYAVGDRLWCRESYRARTWDEDGYFWLEYQADKARSGPLQAPEDYHEAVCADLERRGAVKDEDGNYTGEDGIVPRAHPSIHMPRWASRLTLTVTDVRVQRLQEISEEDARAEGIGGAAGGWWSGAEGQASPSPRGAFALLWNSLHGPGAWNANPWVCALSFTVERRNIDAAGVRHG